MSVSRLDILNGLRSHAQTERLCARASEVCLSAARAKRADWLSAQTVSAEPGPLHGVVPSRGRNRIRQYTFNPRSRRANARRVVCFGGRSCARRRSPVANYRARRRTNPAEREQLRLVAWLGAHTGCNAWAFFALDATSGEGPLWQDVDQCVDAWGPAEQLALSIGLMEAGSEPALRLKASWLERSGNPAIVTLLETSSTSPWLEGQVGSPRANGWLFAVQVISGYALVKTVLASFAQHVLWRRHQARLRVSPRGVEILRKTHILGREFKESRELIPLSEVKRSAT